MSMSVAITPAAVVVIWDIFGGVPFPHALEVRNQAGLVFSGGYAGGRAGYEQGDNSAIYTRPSHLPLYLRSDVDDVTLSFGLDTDFLGDYHVTLTPLVPLSLKGEGGFFREEGRSPS